MYKTTLPLTLVAVSLLAAGQPPSNKPGGDEIPIGGLFNLKGPLAALDIPTMRGAQLAIGEINREGGVAGRRLELIVADGKNQPEKLEKAVEKIVRKNPDVAAFVGLSDTDMVGGAAPAAIRAKRLLLTSGATSPQLPAQFPDYLYLACFGDNVQAAAAAEFAYERLGARTVSILYDSTDTYTTLLQEYFAERFTDLGGTIASSEAYSPGELTAPVSRLQKADAVFLSAHVPDDAIAAIRLLRQSGFDMPILGGDGYDDEPAWAPETEIDDVYFTTHVYLGADSPDPQVLAFNQAYAAAYPGDAATAFAALGYDAVQLVAEAIRRAGGADPHDVLSALAAIRDFDGVSGSISYENGPIPKKSVSIIAIQGGTYRLSAEWTPAGVPAP